MKPILLTIFFSIQSFADISIFISHNNTLSKVTQKELSNLYLKKTSTIHGIKLIPIDSKNQKVYEEFYKKIVKKTPSQIKEYWINQIYTGNRQPPKRLSPEEIQKELKNKSFIISYSKNAIDGKIIFTTK